MELRDTPVLVAGGALGLGLATALALSRCGARVTILDRAEPPPAEGGLSFVRADVTDDVSVRDAVAEAESAQGIARVLVNCAGAAVSCPTVDDAGTPHPLKLFRQVVEINLVGSFNVASQFAARLVRAQPLGEERGVIINAASIGAFEGRAGETAYAAAKAGVAGVTLPMARDLSRFAIRVVTIAPGLFSTPMTADMSEEMLRDLGQQAPFPKRAGDPDEFGRLVVAIVGNPMINGEVIRLDGALRMSADAQ